VLENIKDAIALCLEDLSPKDEKELVKNSGTLTFTTVEV